MLEAIRLTRSAISDFYFELPRMMFLNVLWFITAIPFTFVVFAITVNLWALRADIAAVVLQGGVVLIPVVGLTLALAGPGTAAIYSVINRYTNGELLEPRRFVAAFRHFFWRGWGLAVLDVAAGALLVLNIWFYWSLGRPGVWLVSVIFAYLLVLWFAIQGYLFALLVEMDQSIRLVIRNALFLAIDNLGLTIGLTLANALLLALSLPLGAMLLPFATMAIMATLTNKAVVEFIARYRATGRIISDSPAAERRDA